MQNDPPQGKCLETADSVAMTLKSDGKDVHMEHLSNPIHVSTPAPICVPDTIAQYYDRRKLERWYSDEKVDVACEKFMIRFPEGELDRFQFSINYKRYFMWLARKSADEWQDMYFRAKASHAFSRECVCQLMDALAENPSGPDWLFVDFITWFTDNNFDLHNKFGSGWLDDVKRKKRSRRS